MADVKGRGFFASWSGGKDCCLALHRAVRAGGEPRALLNMCCDDGERSRSHGLRTSVLQAQSRALGIPLVQRAAGWDDYERAFLEALADIKAAGVTDGVFGDIDLEPHREWVERVCEMAGFAPHEPLWAEPRRRLLDEFLDAGFSALVVSVRTDVLPARMLGRTLDRALVAEIESVGADACGEGGEYHTVVTGGPLFVEDIPLEPSDVFNVKNHSCLDLVLAGEDDRRRQVADG